MNNISALQFHRANYKPKVPPTLRQDVNRVGLQKGEMAEPTADKDAIKKLFPKTYGMPALTFLPGAMKEEKKPLNVGVVLSGGQAPGGHNVISGLFDSIKDIHEESQLIGFLGGPSGLEKGRYEVISTEKMDAYRNTGGFDIIGSGRTKLETTEQYDRCIETINKLQLHAVVIIGGDDSNTNAAILAEYLKSKGLPTSVIGVPKTIDGDLKNAFIPISFGFDTAVKTYSELIGNIARDAGSAGKYWHFIKLMGRSASHIALEAGLQTHPNITLISEEVEKKGLSLSQIVQEIVDTVVARAKAGKNYGVVLIPEGLIEFIPSMKALIGRLNEVLAKDEGAFSDLESGDAKVSKMIQALDGESQETFQSLPRSIQLQLLLDRDPHGNVQVSRIDTEILLSELVAKKLASLSSEAVKFSSQHHFFGYEGRCAAPSNFDADYCYSLGCAAAVLIHGGVTGYIVHIRNLSKGAEQWVAGGIPLTMLLNMEKRHGKLKPVIEKALVDLTGPAFQTLASNRKMWAQEDCFSYPGPIQYFGPIDICDSITKTLGLESI